MEYAKGPQGKRQSRPTTTTRGPLFQSRLTADPGLQRQRKLEAELTRFTARPLHLQRQVASPVLRAAELHAQEVNRVEAPRAALQRQVSILTAHLPERAVEGALQRQAERTAPVVAPARPQAPAEWVTVMRAQAQTVEAQQAAGRGLDSRQSAGFTSLQRQVAQSLVQGFRQDRQAPEARQAEYAGHLLSLQRHPLSAPVARGVLGLLPPVQRLSLQRALDTALEQERAQGEQDQAALSLHAIQRQLAELDAEATQPVFQRIQARRGAGNPLPEPIQRHLEQGLNHDLSRVRIHDDAEADVLAKGVNATAFTTGSDIFFRSGQFNPNTQSGLELLAHEVTHTVQQSQGRVGAGVDPDPGLEMEAQQMGARLAQRRPAVQFGTHAKRPGANTVVRTPLQRAVQTQASTVQRWPNPLAALKKVKDRATSAVSSTAKRVQQAAQRAVKSTVARARAVAAPAVKLAQRASARVKAAAQKIGASLGARMQAARAKVGQVGGRVRAAVRGTIGQAKAAARQTSQALRYKAQQLARRAAGAVQRVKQAADQKVNALASRAKGVGRAVLGQVKQTASALGNRAQRLASSVKKAAQPLLDRVSQTARSLQDQVQQAKSGVQARIQGAYKQAKAFLALPPEARRKVVADKLRSAGQKIGNGLQALGQRVRGGLSAAGNYVGQKAVEGWNAAVTAGTVIKNGAVRTFNAAKSGVVTAVNEIRNSPRVQAMGKFLKEAGIQVAKVGTAIVVGGVVIAGAAALTAATGGLAGPALVAALFASGALGGAAGQVVENVLRGKDKNGKSIAWNDGISAKSILTDGALGVALGPAAKLVGGVARGVGRPLLSLVGKTGQAALNVAGKGLHALSPTAARGLASLARVAQTRGMAAATRLAQRVTAGTGSLSQVARRLSARVTPALARAGQRLGGSALGRGFGRLDASLSKNLRTASSWVGRGGRGLAAAVRRNPTLRGIDRSIIRMSGRARGRLQGIGDALAVRGLQVKAGVNRSWRDVRFQSNIS